MGDPGTGRALIVDPGGDAGKIMSMVAAHDLEVASVIHTHAHLDHVLASGEIRALTDAPLLLHRGDKFLWDSLESQCARVGIACQPLPDPSGWLRDGADLSCCGGVAVHTPGHTPGSMSFWFEGSGLLVAGDTLFEGGIGRTDLPGGSFAAIEKSIVTRLFTLADDARVITGHGPETRLATERLMNPFVGGQL
ncbi:MAG: MBL fold metallo-hydrolase [Proteobacteria bacterium]|nr:MBL fold metallo-hydrolase [Pseudomonadota bacterium]